MLGGPAALGDTQAQAFKDLVLILAQSQTYWESLGQTLPPLSLFVSTETEMVGVDDFQDSKQTCSSPLSRP